MSSAIPKRVPIGVLLWDQDRERAKRIVALMEQEGVSCRALNSEYEIKSGNRAACVVLVALGKSAQEQQRAVDLVSELRRQGQAVLAFEDGVASWPLSARCRVLLAGAKEICDSTFPDSLSVFCQQARALHESIEKNLHDKTSTSELFRRMGIVGTSAAMSSMERLALRISKLSDLPVLIEGESGTGKELFARAIHALDPRRSAGPFVAVNCAALPKDLAEAELFGHRRGAFTGAEIERKGLFRAAEGGAIFLDEIGEMKLDLQAKLLRVLQEGRVLPLGEDKETSLDVRAIAATNQDLRSRVEEGMFREDLFHRLNVVPLRIAPLRERTEDIEALVEYFLEKYGHLGSKALEVSREFLDGLEKSRLRGNAREIENIVRKAIASREQQMSLGLSDLPENLLQELSEGAAAARDDSALPPVPSQTNPFGSPATFERVLQDNQWNLARSVKRCERSLLEVAMRRTGGNQSETARLLGVTPRSIYNKLRQLPDNR